MVGTNFYDVGLLLAPVPARKNAFGIYSIDNEASEDEDTDMMSRVIEQ